MIVLYYVCLYNQSFTFLYICITIEYKCNKFVIYSTDKMSYSL